MARYQWRITTNYMSDTSLSFGVSPNTWQNWQTDDTGDKDGGTVTYFYRDANVASAGGAYTDANSSRVAVVMSQSWTTSVDNQNNLTIVLRTAINQIRRDDLRGNNNNTPGRNIRVFESVGGAQLLNLTDNQVATAHTIYNGPLVVEQRTFTLAPGQDATGGQLQVYNQTIGYASYDDIRIGVQFRNILPADYRPGMIMVNGTWQSHNRTNGWAGIMVNGTYREMRTNDGAVGTDNPPLIKHPDGWKNQRKIGANA